MKLTTFHVELSGREMGILQDALNAMIRDCGARISIAVRDNDTTALAYSTQRRVHADLLHDKLHAALHAPAAAHQVA